MIMKLQEMRNQTAELADAFTLAMYRDATGNSSENEYERLLAKYDQLFETPRIRDMRHWSWSDSEEGRIKFALKGYLVGQWFSYQARQHMDELVQAQVRRTIPWEGSQISFREAQSLCSSVSAHERLQLQEVVNEYLDHTLKPAVWHYYRVLDQLAKEIQYDGFLHMIDDLRRYSAASLVQDVKKFVPAAHDIFRDHPIIVPFDFSDKNTCLGAKEAADDMMALGREMNWSLEGVRLEWSGGEQGVAFAFCAPLRVPGDIVLCTGAGSGYLPQRLMYYEMGQGFYYANLDPNLPYEFRRMGDHAVSGAYSALFESLLYNPQWLESRGYPSALARTAALHRTYLVLKYWSKLGAEVEIHQHRLYRAQSEYVHKEWMTRGLPMQEQQSTSPVDMDDELFTAHHVRSWLLAAQLREQVHHKFGDAWFRDPQAGRWLLQWFRQGTAFNADEVSRMLGYEALDCDALLRELEQMLSEVQP